MGVQKGVNGGADGVRTRDLIDAIDARSQLRYGPTDVRLNFFYNIRPVRRQTPSLVNYQSAASALNLSPLRPQTEGGGGSTFGTCPPPHFLLCLKRIRASGV